MTTNKLKLKTLLEVSVRIDKTHLHMLLLDAIKTLAINSPELRKTKQKKVKKNRYLNNFKDLMNKISAKNENTATKLTHKVRKIRNP